MTKFETDIKNFRQQYSQSRTETFFSTDSISSERKFSFLVFKFLSRFLRNVYNKFNRDRSRFQFTSTDSLDLSSIFRFKSRRDLSITHKQIKQLNIFEVINSSSILKSRSRSKNIFSPSTEISIEKIIYDYSIDSQLENMTSLIENAVI